MGMEGLTGWGTAAAAKSLELQLAKINTMQWAHELGIQQTLSADDAEDEDDYDNVPPLASQTTQVHAMLLASQQSFGDSRTILAYASKKEWRCRWRPEQRIRAEVLRAASRQPGGIKGAVEDGWEPTVQDLRRLNAEREILD